MFTDATFTKIRDNTPIGYAYHELVYDEHNIPMDYKILDYNNSYLEIIGCTSKDIRNNYIYILFPNLKNEISLLFESVIEAVLHKKNTSVTGYVPSFKKWLTIHFIPLESNYFIAQLIDISKEKELETRLKAKSNELELILDVIPDFVIVTDSSGEIIRYNNAWERLLGYKSKNLISKNIRGFIHPEDTDKVLYDFKNGLLFNKNHILRCRILKANGQYIYTEWKSSTYGELSYSVGRDISEIIEKEKEIHYLSYHDKLTGLYNRAFFEEELNRLDNNRELPLSIIMGDVNGLKIVNDVFGHFIGDKMLKTIANILRDSTRKGDIVSRWGGDEFVILLPNASESVTKEIIHRINFNCNHKELDLDYANISLGYSIKDSESQDIRKVLIEAENNMYKNKLLDGKKVRNVIISSMIQYLFDNKYEVKSHIDRMKFYSEKISKKLNLSESDKNNLLELAELHDIGLVSIPKEIVNKTDRLIDWEIDIIKSHPEVGYRIAKSLPELSSIADYILYHHERWDGKGYPHGLKGEEIPYLARIFSIIDVFDSLTQNKPYRKSKTKKQALSYLKQNKSIRFDPDLVDVFINLIHENSSP